ncbi:MAG: hypothetical protein JOZ33_00810 [Acidobacteriaceae bacterium]|nr:hypothetical protein [Acidobacteriaceae bacterium]
MRMRRVLTALVLAGAIALTVPPVIFAQHGGGHAGGFSGGHVGGFSGGGFTAPHFSAPSFGFGAGGFAPRSFPAPRTNLMPGSASSGPMRFAPSVRPYSGFYGPRSPFGQLRMAPTGRAPYAGNVSRGWTSQPNHSGNYNWSENRDSHGEDHHGNHDHHYRRPYYGGAAVYSWYYAYPYYSSWYNWPWWPYYGDWNSGDESDTTAPPAQAPNQYPDQYGAPTYQDQYSAPEAPQQYADPSAYRPAIAGSPGVAISEPTVIIVYKDGHSEQIHNYALTRSALLMMDNASAGYSLLIPLSLIDLPATQQANRATGVDFRLPARN